MRRLSEAITTQVGASTEFETSSTSVKIAASVELWIAKGLAKQGLKN